MKRFYWGALILGLFGIGWAILYAAGGVDSLTYRPVSDDKNAVSSDESERSVRDNLTYAVKIPRSISFAGEPVPLDKGDVRERLDRELTVNSYWHSSSILLLKRAHRWFPLIEKILKEQGVPDDFKYLALAESGLDNVVSSMGATGFWQFREAAASEYGLTVNSEVDERYHVEKATRAACAYLKSMKEDFGSWTLAAAAYNVGPTGLKRQMDRQRETNYYDLILPDETTRYVFRILALKSLHSAPEDFGFHLEEADMYPPYKYKEVVVDGEVESWPAFCDEHDITYRELKLLNPWLRETFLTNRNGRSYTVKVMEK